MQLNIASLKKGHNLDTVQLKKKQFTSEHRQHHTDIREQVVDHHTPQVNVLITFFVGHQGGRTPTGWPHTAQSGEPDGRGPEAKPHQRDTPNTLSTLCTGIAVVLQDWAVARVAVGLAAAAAAGAGR